MIHKECDVCNIEIKSGNICSECSREITTQIDEIKRRIKESRKNKTFEK